MRQQIKKLQSVVHDQQELLRTFEQIINNFNHDNDNILQWEWWIGIVVLFYNQTIQNLILRHSVRIQFSFVPNYNTFYFSRRPLLWWWFPSLLGSSSSYIDHRPRYIWVTNPYIILSEVRIHTYRVILCSSTARGQCYKFQLFSTPMWLVWDIAQCKVTTSLHKSTLLCLYTIIAWIIHNTDHKGFFLFLFSKHSQTWGLWIYLFFFSNCITFCLSVEICLS